MDEKVLVNRFPGFPASYKGSVLVSHSRSVRLSYDFSRSVRRGHGALRAHRGEEGGPFALARGPALCERCDGVVHGIGDLFQRRVGGAKRRHGVKDRAQRSEKHPLFQTGRSATASRRGPDSRPASSSSTAAMIPQTRTSRTRGWPRKGASASLQKSSMRRGAGWGAPVSIFQLATATAQANGWAVNEWP